MRPQVTKFGVSDDSPDRGQRFLKEKLDDLPEGLLKEVRKRNTHLTRVSYNVPGDMTRRSLVVLPVASWCRTFSTTEQDGSDHESALRAGRFQEALTLAGAALAANPDDIRATLTRIRVCDMHFHSELAEAEYTRVTSRTGNSPQVLSILPELSFAEARRDLIDAYLRRSTPDLSAAERLRGLRAWLDKAADGRLCSALRPASAIRCSMRRLKESPRNPGLLGLKVKVNGSKPLNFLLNSSAFGLWMAPRRAREAGVSSIYDGWIAEPGMYGRVHGRYGFAERVEVAGLTVRNVPVFEADAAPFKLWDGVIGLSTFRDLLVRINESSPSIAFEPLPSAPPAPPGQRIVPETLGGAIKCIRGRHILLLPGGIGKDRAIFLLQFQAEASVVNRPTPPDSNIDSLSNWFTGFSCGKERLAHTVNVEISLASERGVLAMRNCDLAETSAKLGLPVDGVIGLNFIRNRTVAIDQSRGLVSFA